VQAAELARYTDAELVPMDRGDSMLPSQPARPQRFPAKGDPWPVGATHGAALALFSASASVLL
jgi:hypothetical protein